MKNMKILEYELRDLLLYLAEADSMSCRDHKNIIDNVAVMIRDLIDKISDSEAEAE